MTKSARNQAANSRDASTPANDRAGGASAPETAATPRSSIRVRRANAADARAIAEIGVRGWQAAYRGILPEDFLAGLSAAPREVAWRTMLESDEDAAAAAWIAESGGRPVGYMAGGPPRDEDVPLPAAEVYALYVLPEAWRRGVGRALLLVAANYLREGGATTLTLWVLEDNAAAQAFYKAFGWRADGARQEVDLGGFTATEVRYRLPLSR